MRKGFYGPVIIIIAIAVILISEMITVSTIFEKERTEHRHMMEASLISQADKVETYVRSFSRAADLSSIQAINIFGDGTIVLPYDFSTVRYSSNYRMPYWQIYDSLIPPNEILMNRARQQISWFSSCLLTDYLSGYNSFPGGEMIIIGSPILNVEGILPNSIPIKHSDRESEMEIHTSDEFEGNLIKIDRAFRPNSEIITKFGDTVSKAESIVRNDLLGKFMRNELSSYVHAMDNLADVRAKLNQLANDQSSPPVTVILRIPADSDWVYDAGGTTAAIINVIIYDSSVNYPAYDFLIDNASSRYLGMKFLVKAGHKGSAAANTLGSSEEVIAQNVINPAVGCSSGLGIIGQKNLCDFFALAPTFVSEDTDLGSDYVTPGVCTDFTGSYSDICFDMDGNGGQETLYEYYIHDSNICHYQRYLCPAGCDSGACKVLCDNDLDCEDFNPCTGVESAGGIDKCRDAGLDTAWCDNPNLPSTYIPPGDACGITPRTCTAGCSQNCNAIGNTWMCDSDADQTCSNRCNGGGGCDGCTPPVCAQEDCGCADDTYCIAKHGAGYKCKISTHECVLDECDSDSECTGAKTDCQYWVCDRPADPDSDCILNNYNNGYIPSGNACGTNTRSCSGKCELHMEYRNAVNDPETCSIECDGSGNCKSSCTPPDCSYNFIRTCAYGCKDGMNCWQGYFCPSKTCGDTCCFPCIGTSCNTWATCIREDMLPPTCTWRDKWDSFCCGITCSCGIGEWCEWPCCTTDRTCTADCSYSNTCTYL